MTRVLIVDHHFVSREITAVMLRRLGCTVDVSEGGQDAIERVRHQAYDVIFMDGLMPGMDGYETTRAIRALGFTPDALAVVGLTAGAPSEDRPACLDAGMNDHLSKPLVAADLERMLARYARDFALPLFDEAKLRRMRELIDGSGGWHALMKTFLDDSRETVARMQRALEEDATDLLRREAHRLKGSSGMMSATRLAGSCAELEQAAVKGTAEVRAALVARIVADFAETGAALLQAPTASRPS